MTDRASTPRRTKSRASSSAEAPEKQSTTTLLLSAAARYWYLIALCTVVAGAVGWGYGATRPDTYQSTASIYFRNSSVACRVTGSCTGEFGDADRRYATQLAQIQLPSVSTRAATALGDGWTTNDVQNSFAVAQGGQSDIVEVTATSENAADAAAIANAVVDAAVAFRAENSRRDAVEALSVVTKRLTRLSKAERAGVVGQELTASQARLRLEVSAPGGDAEVAQRARVPQVSVTRSPAKTAILAGGLGFFLGLGLALLRARMDPRVISQEQLLQLWPLPVLATLPRDRELAKGTYRSASSASLAPLLIARTSLRYLSSAAEAQVVGVTSAIAGEGKTTVSWGLASAAAAEGARVLLIEADLRAPSIQRSRGVAESPGVAGYLAGEAAFDEIVRGGGEGADLSFDVIPAGATAVSPLPLLRGDRTAELFAAARELYEFIVVDLPPVTLVPDALTLASHVDGFVSVVRMRWASPGEVSRARDLLEDLNEDDTPVFGLVVNQNRGAVPVAYGSPVNRSASRR